MELHSKEIERVSNLEPFERYKYFLKRVADSESLYTLKSDNGNYVISEIDDNRLFPMWSAREYAELCKENGWSDCIVEELTLHDLEEEIFDLIASERYLINVFPTQEKTGFIVDLDEFARDLSDELKHYQ